MTRLEVERCLTPARISRRNKSLMEERRDIAGLSGTLYDGTEYSTYHLHMVLVPSPVRRDSRHTRRKVANTSIRRAIEAGI